MNTTPRDNAHSSDGASLVAAGIGLLIVIVLHALELPTLNWMGWLFRLWGMA